MVAGTKKFRETVYAAREKLSAKSPVIELVKKKKDIARNERRDFDLVIEYSAKARWPNELSICLEELRRSLSEEKNYGFGLSPGGKKLHLRAKLPGIFFAENLSLAFLVCKIFGIATEKILQTIEKIRKISGRMEIVDLKGKPTAIVDYAHSPDSMRAVLRHAKLSGKEIITVFGCGGERDKGKRPIMTKIAVQNSSMVIATEDNCRNESFEKIFTDMTKNLSEQEKRKIIKIENRKSAITYAIDISDKNKLILLLGRGREDLLLSNKGCKELNDYITVSQLLKKRNKSKDSKQKLLLSNNGRHIQLSTLQKRLHKTNI